CFSGAGCDCARRASAQNKMGNCPISKGSYNILNRTSVQFKSH
ncbi:MAG: hypothetical protein ACI9OO_001691, partial [Bacteroidia bacterium]